MFMRMQILDLAQKYSVGLQEVFVCLQVLLPGRKFFFPALGLSTLAHLFISRLWEIKLLIQT
jgi:hypothetical protein